MATAATARSRATALLLTCLALAACGGGGAAVTTPGEEPLVAALRIDPPSTSLPVGGTVRLSGVPTDGSGNPLSGLPAPVFTSGDPNRASVTPDGMVTGRAPGEATITATLAAGGVTRTASATVLVTAAAAPGGPPTTTPPAAPSTATVDAGDHAFSPSTVTIAAGGTVTWRMVDDEHDITWTGAAPTGGNIPKTDEGVSVSRTFSTPGTYTYRCARHESKGKTGTVVVTGQQTQPPATPPATPPPSGSTATVTTPGSSFSPATVTIARGGTVNWEISGATHNVTFQGAAPTGGNIPDTRSGTVSRVFPTAGSYPYSCTRHSGMNGSVVVQ